jgi:hypothetical protein
LIVEKSAEQLHNYLEATIHLMQVLARACGHAHLNEFCVDDLTTYNRDTLILPVFGMAAYCQFNYNDSK